MLQSLKAVVLNSIKYGESGIISHVYTDKLGRRSFLIHGVRKKKSKMNAYLFQPLNVLDIIAYLKENRDLHNIKEVRPSFQLINLHFDISRSTIATFLGEILYKTLRDTESNPQLFEYLTKAIQLLDLREEGIANIHLIFLLQFSRFLGIFPEKHTELHHYECNASMQITDLLQYSLSDCNAFKLDKNSRRELLHQIINYYKDHIDGLDTIKSLEVLEEVFH